MSTTEWGNSVSPNIMSTCGFRTALLGSVAGTLVLAAVPVQAATTTTEEIVITGSRIPTRDLTSNSPLMTVGQEQIQQTGTTQIESLLNTLPQFSPSLTMSSNNPSSGGFFGGGFHPDCRAS